MTRTEEIRRAIEFLREKAGPDADLVGVGLSMGANLMIKLAGQMGSEFPLKAIASVSCPFDVWLAINLMRGSPYEINLARELVSSLIAREKPVSDSDSSQLDKMIAHYNLDMDKVSRC